ncbi:MAG: PQQ-binding-like beta-propeller repeat protein [Myxococcota bacterium]
MPVGRVVASVAIVGSLAALAWWFLSAPPGYLVVGPPIDFGETPEAIREVEAVPGSIGRAIRRIDSAVPGHDDLLVRETDGVAFVSGMDGFIWRVPLDGGPAERFADVPLMPSGLRTAPDDPNFIYFCTSRLHGVEHAADERVGLYRLNLATREVDAVVTEVAATPPIPEAKRRVYADEDLGAPTLRPESGPGDSRPLAFCNDLDITDDGRRIYFTEPIAYEGASMGGGAVGEAITLGDNGRLWRHDLDTGETRLVADGFHFIDGILVDPSPDGERESSVLVTQTPGFAITRFFFAGPNAGHAEEVWTSLPGMPDGMDRGEDGRIWVGLFRKRSAFLTWAHKNPWVKPLLLRLPLDLLPVPKETGVLGLSEDGSEPLYYAMYQGPELTDAAVVVPGKEHLYIANFDVAQRGILRMPYPSRRHRLNLKDRLGEKRPATRDQRPPELSMNLAALDGDRLVVRRDAGPVLRWDLRTGEATVLGSTGSLFAPCQAMGQALVNDDEGQVSLLLFDSGERIPVSSDRHDYAAWNATCTRFVISAEHRSTIELWAADPWRKVAEVPTSQPVRNGLAMSPDGELVAAAEGTYDKDAGHQTEIEIFRVDGDALVRTASVRDPDVHRGMWTMVFAPDGSALFVGTQAGGKSGIAALDVQTGQPRWHHDDFESYWVRAIAVSPDGETLATGDEKGRLTLWDAHSGEPRTESEVGQVIQALAFTDDGERLATSLWDTTVAVVDLRELKE